MNDVNLTGDRLDIGLRPAALSDRSTQYSRRPSHEILVDFIITSQRVRVEGLDSELPPDDISRRASRNRMCRGR